MHFGQWVKTHRENLNLSQVECAERAAIRPQTWYKMEKETVTPKHSTIEKVARAFGITPTDVMSLSGLSKAFANPDDEMAEWIARAALAIPAEKREEFRRTAKGAISGIASSFAHA